MEFYLKLFVLSPFIYLSYHYRKKILYELFSFYSLCVYFIETNNYVKKILTLSDSTDYYSLEQKKYVNINDINDGDIGFIMLKEEGQIKYVMFKDINKTLSQIDYNSPKIFSSVVLSYKNLDSSEFSRNKLDCEDTLNKFVLSETLLFLDKTMAETIFKINNIDTKNIDLDTIYWSIITRKGKMYEGKKITFSIDINYNLRK